MNSFTCILWLFKVIPWFFSDTVVMSQTCNHYHILLPQWSMAVINHQHNHTLMFMVHLNNLPFLHFLILFTHFIFSISRVSITISIFSFKIYTLAYKSMAVKTAILKNMSHGNYHQSLSHVTHKWHLIIFSSSIYLMWLWHSSLFDFFEYIFKRYNLKKILKNMRFI